MARGERRSTKGPRWWPAIVVLLLAAVGVIHAWTNDGASGRQERVMVTGAIVLLTGLGLFLWLALLSRLRWRTRILGVALVFLGLGVFASLVRIRGVTGDLVPILDWRWASGETDLRGAVVAGGASLSGRPSSPQFLGPGRNGVVGGVRLDPDWESSPPVEIWRREIGEGFSSFAVVGDLAVTQEQRGDEELVVAYDRDSGEVRWVHGDPARYSTAIAGTGPRATPTISDQRVFTIGATGILNALDLATGDRLWSHDIVAEHGGSRPEWGVAGSPLVVELEGSAADGSESTSNERLVVVHAGGAGASVVAYAFDDGRLVWRSGDDAMSYSAPALVELAGERQIVQFGLSSVAGYRIEDGELLWTHPWSRAQPNVAQPLPLADERLLVSSGYGIGAELLEVSRAGRDHAVGAAWTSTRLKAKFATPVFHRGSIYGLDDGVLICLDPATGERRWKRGRYGHGQVLLVGELLLIQAEDGSVVLVEANPREHVELARLEALSSRTWNPPALAGDQLFVRNDREVAVYRVPVLESSLPGEG